VLPRAGKRIVEGRWRVQAQALWDVESSSYRCSIAGYRRGEERMRPSIQLKQCNLFAPDITPQMFAAEMRIRLVDLLSALLLEVISGQYPELTTAVEEQDSE
jgi:hypothetical protein